MTTTASAIHLNFFYYFHLLCKADKGDLRRPARPPLKQTFKSPTFQLQQEQYQENISGIKCCSSTNREIGNTDLRKGIVKPVTERQLAPRRTRSWESSTDLQDSETKTSWLYVRREIQNNSFTGNLFIQNLLQMQDWYQYIQGDFFNWASPEFAKCWPVSE